MRMRKKLWAEPELADCDYFIKEPKVHRGHWQEAFAARRPIYLDLGCGKGVFLAQSADEAPAVNWIGIDISPDILGVARRRIHERFQGEQPGNLLFFRYNIEALQEVFSKADGIARIYINFCNPWPTSRGHKRRLTHTRQLETYRQFLKPGGEIWFKTDDQDLYIATRRYFREMGIETIAETTDLHQAGWTENIQTEHEVMFTERGEKIKAIRGRWQGESDERKASVGGIESAQGERDSFQQENGEHEHHDDAADAV